MRRGQKQKDRTRCPVSWKRQFERTMRQAAQVFKTASHPTRPIGCAMGPQSISNGGLTGLAVKSGMSGPRSRVSAPVRRIRGGSFHRQPVFRDLQNGDLVVSRHAEKGACRNGHFQVAAGLAAKMLDSAIDLGRPYSHRIIVRLVVD